MSKNLAFDVSLARQLDIPGENLKGFEEYVGCKLCQLVCPIDSCITMEVHRVSPDPINQKQWQERGLPLNDH
jgi:formate hydrogenlyase subunit 6/NADH:ubiquinone oxidoreductase subunit I